MTDSQGDNVPICFIAQLVEHCNGNDVRKPGSRQCSNLLYSSVGETLQGK